MRIGIDATHIQKHGKGVSRYLKNIIPALAQRASRYQYYVFCNKREPVDFGISKPNWKFIPVSVGSAFWFQQVGLPFLFRKHRLDLVHTAYDNLACWTCIPSVIYLFEIPDYRLASGLGLAGGRWYQDWVKKFYKMNFPKTIRNSLVVAASSDFTRKDLLEKYFLPEARVQVVYAAHEPDFQPQSDPEKLKAICEREADGFNYFLHFSTGDPRDNTPVVLEAYQRARRQFKKEMKLVIVGCPKTRYAQAQEVSQSGIMYHDFATGTKLLELYQGALAYVDPSLFEGFGFQPLEAMACGVPVVASNVTSIPEIVGEAGILLAPQDVEGFRDAMIQMANNPSLGEHMREQSIRRARLFNWETTARQIESCFEKALTYARRN